MTYMVSAPGTPVLIRDLMVGHLFLDMPLPDDAYASYGFGGQYLLVIPSLDLVVVHLGNSDQSSYHPPTVEQTRHLLQLILQASPHKSL